MSLIKLAWKNIIHNPLNLLLNLILLALGIGLINFILLVNHQLKDKFDKNLAGIDLVIGAKGSPLQMILSSMYHIDAPTGNITIKEGKAFLREGHPLIKTAVPLSMGDSYKGYRIIGTDHTILKLYNAEISEGKLWNNVLEVTAGHEVALKLGLKLGTTFKSSHGFNDDEDLTHDHGTFKVVGILKPTGSVIDQLLLCNTETVWEVHDHQAHEEESPSEDSTHDHDGHDHDGHDHEGHDHDGHDHEGHDHDGHDHEGHDHEGHDHDGHDHEGHDHDGHDHEGHDHEGHDHDGHDHDGHDHDGHDHDGHDHDKHDHEGHDHNGHDHAHDHSSHKNDMSRAHLLSHEDQEITSILLQFTNRTNFQALSLGRNINENTDMQAASPAYEINRLYDMMGSGTRALQLLAILIAIVSAISIFISLLNSLKQRKYELSLLRVLGGRPRSLLSLILIEGLIMALLGFIIGMICSNLALSGLDQNLSDKYNYEFSSWILHGKEQFLFAGTMALGLLAALLPAFMAYRTDIHKNLSVG